MLITEKELEHRLAETFPKLAKKHHISDFVFVAKAELRRKLIQK